MALIAPDGSILEANDAFARIIGYSALALRGIAVQSLVHPEDLNAAMVLVQRLLDGKAQAVEAEMRFLHERGHVLWMQLNATLVRGAASRPLYLLWQLQDLTRRHHAERKLLASEERWRFLLATLPLASYHATRAIDGEIRDICVRPSLRAMLGVAQDAPDEHNLALLDSLHPDDRDRFLGELGRCARTLTPTVLEARQIVGPDDEIRCWRLHVSPRQMPDGSAELDGIALDVTDNKSLEHRMSICEEALGSISQAIAILDARTPDHPLRYVNPAFERITGYALEECLGRSWRFLEGPSSDPDVLCRMRADMSEERPFQGELVYHRRDGSTYVCEIALTPIREESGRLTHFLGVMEDITPRRNLEAQLRQALKVEAVGKLTGGVAHDFNNLLLIAHGNLELLNDALESGEPNLGEFVGRAQQAVLRGADLTRRLLAFARLQPLKASATDLNQLVTDLMPLMSRTLGEDAQVEIALQQGLEMVVVDRSQVENALLNLAVNARDAMPRGGRLTITTRNVSINEARPADLPEQSYACLSVSDTGEGMTPEVRDRAFEPFFTTKPLGKGTGLGLSMVYGFARQSGGSAELASKPGQGTTVSIYLPSVKPDVPSEGCANASVATDVDANEA